MARQHGRTPAEPHVGEAQRFALAATGSCVMAGRGGSKHAMRPSTTRHWPFGVCAHC